MVHFRLKPPTLNNKFFMQKDILNRINKMKEFNTEQIYDL